MVLQDSIRTNFNYKQNMLGDEDISACNTDEMHTTKTANVRSKIEQIEAQLRGLCNSLDPSSTHDNPINESYHRMESTIPFVEDTCSQPDSGVDLPEEIDTKPSTQQISASHGRRRASSQTHERLTLRQIVFDDVEDEQTFNFTEAPARPDPLPVFVSLPPMSSKHTLASPSQFIESPNSNSISLTSTKFGESTKHNDERSISDNREQLSAQFSCLSMTASADTRSPLAMTHQLQKSKSLGLQKSTSIQYHRSVSDASHLRRRAVSTSQGRASPAPITIQQVQHTTLLDMTTADKQSLPLAEFNRPCRTPSMRLALSSTFPNHTEALYKDIPTHAAAARRPSAPAVMHLASANNMYRSMSSLSGMRKFQLDLACAPEHKEEKGIVLMDPNATERVGLGLGSGSDKADKVLGIDNENCRTTATSRSVKKVPSWKIKNFGNFKAVLNNMTGLSAKERRKVREEWERRQLKISPPIDVHKV